MSAQFFTKINYKHYGYVIAVASLLGLQNFSFAYLTQMPARQKAFTKEFIDQNFGEYHKMNLGQDTTPPYYGYPDLGAGYYSKLLPYKDWFTFNCAQRVHSNSIEHLTWVLPLFLINGIFFPKLTTTLGCVVFIGREFYRYGYMSREGPNSYIRELGAIPLNIAEILLITSLGFVISRHFLGGFVSRRKIIRRFKMSKYDLKMEQLIKEQEKAKRMIK